MKKPLGLALAAAALLAAAWSWSHRGAGTDGRPRPETVVVERRTLERTVEAVGVAEPAFTLEVKSKASGQITSMPFHEGDRVEEGMLLVELLPVDEERNVRTQRTRVASAEAELAKARTELAQAELRVSLTREQVASKVARAEVEREVARAELARQQHLFDRQLASQKALDDARGATSRADAELELARSEERSLRLTELDLEARRQDLLLREAALEQQRIALEVAEIRLEETRIVAPMDGIVLTREVEPGQIIASGISNVSGGTTLMTLADVGRLYLDAEVDESDIGGIEAGLPVELTAEAFRDREFRGAVERVAPRGEEIESVTVFRVRIELGPEAVRLLKPGMNATARIVLERREDVLAVPVRALQREGRRLGVRVRQGSGAARFVPIQRGLRQGQWMEVRGDLRAGDVLELPGEDAGDGGDAGRDLRRGMRALRRGGS